MYVYVYVYIYIYICLNTSMHMCIYNEYIYIYKQDMPNSMMTTHVCIHPFFGYLALARRLSACVNIPGIASGLTWHPRIWWVPSLWLGKPCSWTPTTFDWEEQICRLPLHPKLFNQGVKNRLSKKTKLQETNFQQAAEQDKVYTPCGLSPCRRGKSHPASLPSPRQAPPGPQPRTPWPVTPDGCCINIHWWYGGVHKYVVNDGWYVLIHG